MENIYSAKDNRRLGGAQCSRAIPRMPTLSPSIMVLTDLFEMVRFRSYL